MRLHFLQDAVFTSVQECDATGDTMKTKCRVYNF